MTEAKLRKSIDPTILQQIQEEEVRLSQATNPYEKLQRATAIVMFKMANKVIPNPSQNPKLMARVQLGQEISRWVGSLVSKASLEMSLNNKSALPQNQVLDKKIIPQMLKEVLQTDSLTPMMWNVASDLEMQLQ